MLGVFARRAITGWIAVSLLAACGEDSSPSPGANGSNETGWEAIRNPVLTLPANAVKDAFAVRHEGKWHLGYSHITETPFRFRLGFSTTSDWRTFEEAPVIDQLDVGGLASPTVVRASDGSFVMTYNSHTRDVGDALNKLYWRTSSDLRTWSEPHRFHVEGADGPEDRLIDAAVAFTGGGAFLFFKREQIANVAHSPSGSLDGPWQLLGPIEPERVENLQVLQIDGTWHLLATSLLPHRPILHRLEGDPAVPASWTRWSRVRELEIVEQGWNTGRIDIVYERANAGYLVDERAADGFFYLVYAGSTELGSYEGRGHAKLGLARSRDLVSWESPRERILRD
jgi:hypothetical protein